MKNPDFGPMLSIGAAVLIGIAVLLLLIAFFPNFFWWIAFILLALGIIMMTLAVIVTILFNADVKKHPEVDLEGPGPALVFVCGAISALVIALSALVLIGMWLFDLAPETFYFLGQGPLSLPRPDYYAVGSAVTWITIGVLCLGPIWMLVEGIIALVRRINKH